MNRNRVLLTGSSGTVGTALAERLLSKGYEVSGADIVPNRWSSAVDDRTTLVNLCDPEDVSTLPTDVDMLLHLGAHARVHQLVKEPRNAMENLEMTFNVLEHARRAEIPNFVFASSREVYGDTEQVVYAETDTNADRSESPYTASKVGGEALTQSYNQCYGLSTSIVRFSNVYGRYDGSNRVIPLFIALSEQGEPLTVYGSDKVLDFTYLDDCVAGMTKVVDRFPTVSGSTLNISSGKGTSLIELARAVNERTPNDSSITVEPTREGEIRRYVGDISRARSILSYEPQYSFDDGLDETIEWYLDNPSVLEEIRENARSP